MDAELRVHMRDMRFHGVVGNDERFLNVSRIAPAGQKAENLALAFRQTGVFRKLKQPVLKSLLAAFALENAHLGRRNMTLEATKGINDGLIENGYIVVADTIEELAEGLGLPAEALKKTVERQNENYDAGIDPDFGKDAHRLSAIRTAPFYGVRTSGYMLCTLDGITINENFQAVDDNGKAIEGLYVTGIDSGSYYAHTYPNMSTGNCCGRSVTFGRMIGKALAAK